MNRLGDPANDLVGRVFTAPAPNLLWVADITYVPTAAGFLFLAVVLDVWSRRIVGWAMATDLRTRLLLDALDMAVTTRKPADDASRRGEGQASRSPAVNGLSSRSPLATFPPRHHMMRHDA